MTADEGQGIVRQFVRGRISRREFMVRALGLGVSAATVASVLAACGGDSDEENVRDSAVVKAPPPGPKGSVLEVYTRPVDDAFDPPIQLTTVRQTVPTIKYESGDDVNNNPWTRAYARKYGIVVETLWAVDASQFEQKTDLMMGSGDLPDFFLANQEQLQQLVEADQLADLTEVYETQASERVKDVIMEGGPIPLESATFDGRLMAIPFTYPNKEGTPVIWVRTDWLKKLDLPEPETMEDFLRISEEFTASDPDGNGKDDTFGLALDQDLGLGIGFMNGHHAYRGIWIEDESGKLVYGSVQPEMREALQQLQQMHEAGQIDREFGAKDPTRVYEDITAGRIGLWYGSGYSGFYPLQVAKTNNPDAEWRAYPIVSADEQPARVQVEQPTVGGYWVVRKDVENPEAIMKMLDFWVQTFYESKERELYEYFVQSGTSEVWQMKAASVYKTYKNLDQSKAIVEVMNGEKDESELTAEGRDVLNKVTAYENGEPGEEYVNWAWWANYGPEGAMLNAIDEYVSEDLFAEDQFYATPTQTMSQRGPNLEKLEDETFTKIIRGAPIEEFDRFVEQWKQLGGDKMTDEVNEWYAEQP
jgi:putative aldouronate transport system substrate-binding protein